MIAALSMPQVRKWSYEVFQLGHLLMFALLGLLCAHGTAQLLQFAMMGYWLLVPIILVLIERITRTLLGFQRVPARLEVLDDDTVNITITIPKHRLWRYVAGQYEVPQISYFQWHPFTISTCTEREIQLHIKTDGNWVSKLKGLTKEKGSDLKWVGIDGPYGAPAQRFYDFDQSIIFGAGTGVTPFSGILHDLRVRSDEGWRSRASSISSTSRRSSISSSSITIRQAHTEAVSNDHPEKSGMDCIDPTSEKPRFPMTQHPNTAASTSTEPSTTETTFSGSLTSSTRSPHPLQATPTSPKSAKAFPPTFSAFSSKSIAQTLTPPHP
jgi:FAD-binding domain